MLLFFNLLKTFLPSVIQTYVDYVCEEVSIYVKILFFAISFFCVLWVSGVFDEPPSNEEPSYGHERMMILSCTEPLPEPYCNDEYVVAKFKQDCKDFYEFHCNADYILKIMIEECSKYEETGYYGIYKEDITNQKNKES